MMTKYNMALLPRTKNSEIVNLVSLFQVNFGPYRLGPNSNAHVTILQFYMNENEIYQAWHNVCKKVGDIEVNLSFEHLSCNSFDQKFYWVTLIPSENSFLYKLHFQVSEILNLKSKRKFEPHLTLFNSPENICESIQNVSFPTISDDFYLAIGLCDEVGQFIQTI